MPAERQRPPMMTEDLVLGGAACGLRSRGAGIGSGTTRFCWRPLPGDAGEHVVDLGAGSARPAWRSRCGSADVSVTLVEIDPALAALAAENAELNGLAARVRAVISMRPRRRAPSRPPGLRRNRSPACLMNPPFNDPARQRLSPDRRRRLAHAAPRETLGGLDQDRGPAFAPARHADPDLSGGWPGGVWRGARSGSSARCAILPVYPKPDEPAIRVLVRATKASRAPLAMLPGLVLNDAGDARPRKPRPCCAGARRCRWPESEPSGRV